MDDLAGKLSELLENPEGLESIRSMAQSLLGSSDLSGLMGPTPGASQEAPENTGGAAQMPSVSPDEMQTMMKIGKALSKMGNQNDDRARLLMALRPHLSPERQGRVDTAVKLLKLVSVMPLLTENGLF